jgi:hypothetical protein
MRFSGMHAEATVVPAHGLFDEPTHAVRRPVDAVLGENVQYQDPTPFTRIYPLLAGNPMVTVVPTPTLLSSWI